MDQFAASLDALDEAFIMPIYPAREHPIDGVRAEGILAKMNNKEARILQKNEIVETIEKVKPEVLLTLGAGDIGLEVANIKAFYNHKMSIV